MDSASLGSLISSDKVVMFSASWCPYCHKAKALFKGLGVPFKLYELDQMSEGDAIKGALKK